MQQKPKTLEENAKTRLTTRQEKREKLEKFFGPDIRVNLTQPEESRIDVALIATPPAASS